MGLMAGPSIFVQNFGCRATQADGAALEAQLAGRGMPLAEAREAADIVILNTCTVTSTADEDARSTIRRVRRKSWRKWRASNGWWGIPIRRRLRI